jgi:hypothetical protein
MRLSAPLTRTCKHLVLPHARGDDGLALALLPHHLLGARRRHVRALGYVRCASPRLGVAKTFTHTHTHAAERADPVQLHANTRAATSCHTHARAPRPHAVAR